MAETRGLKVVLRKAPGQLTRKDVLRRPLILQCLIGDEFSVSREGGHTEYDTVSEGQFSQPYAGKRAPILDDLTIDTMTLTWDAKWLTYGADSARRIRKELNRIVESRDPVHVSIFLTPGAKRIEFTGLVTLRRVERTLRFGETDTRYYSLEFKRYRDPSIRRRGKRGRGGKEGGTRHKLKEEDTLRFLARNYYGVGDHWQLIAEANGIKKWGGHDRLVKMNRYKVGDRITIPPGSGGVSPSDLRRPIGTFVRGRGGRGGGA